jgi:hypothetical protein
VVVGEAGSNDYCIGFVAWVDRDDMFYRLGVARVCRGCWRSGK